MDARLILALICFLVPPKHQQKETISDAKARYATIATAVSHFPHPLYLLTVARHESAFRRDVHRGHKRGDDGRSWGLFQVLCGRGGMAKCPDGTPAHKIVGTTLRETISAVELASRILEGHIEACGEKNPRCVFMRYGGVKDPKDERIEARVNTYRKLWTREN